MENEIYLFCPHEGCNYSSKRIIEAPGIEAAEIILLRQITAENPVCPDHQVALTFTSRAELQARRAKARSNPSQKP